MSGAHDCVLDWKTWGTTECLGPGRASGGVALPCWIMLSWFTHIYTTRSEQFGLVFAGVVALHGTRGHKFKLILLICVFYPKVRARRVSARKVTRGANTASAFCQVRQCHKKLKLRAWSISTIRKWQHYKTWLSELYGENHKINTIQHNGSRREATKCCTAQCDSVAFVHQERL